MSKRKTKLKQRYLLDIVSRWKIGSPKHEIDEQFRLYRYYSEATDAEFQSFVQSVEDEICQFEKTVWEDLLRRKRTTILAL